jgi:hypothetical protein
LTLFTRVISFCCPFETTEEASEKAAALSYKYGGDMMIYKTRHIVKFSYDLPMMKNEGCDDTICTEGRKPNKKLIQNLHVIRQPQIVRNTYKITDIAVVMSNRSKVRDCGIVYDDDVN